MTRTCENCQHSSDHVTPRKTKLGTFDLCADCLEAWDTAEFMIKAYDLAHHYTKLYTGRLATGDRILNAKSYLRHLARENTVDETRALAEKVEELAEDLSLAFGAHPDTYRQAALQLREFSHLNA